MTELSNFRKNFASLPPEMKNMILPDVLVINMDGSEPGIISVLRGLECYAHVASFYNETNFNLTVNTQNDFISKSTDEIKKIKHLRIGCGTNGTDSEGVNSTGHNTSWQISGSSALWKLGNNLSSVLIDLTRCQYDRIRSGWEYRETGYILKLLALASGPGVRYVEVKFGVEPGAKAGFFREFEWAFGYAEGTLAGMGGVDEQRGVWVWGGDVVRLGSIQGRP